MPVFVMLSNLTERGRDRIKHHPERILEVNHEVEQMGCKVLAQYALMGQFDFLTIIEADSNVELYRLAIELGSRGTLTPLTMPALDSNEFVRMLGD